MDKNYDPKKIEDKWRDRWLESGVYHSDAGRGGEPYCIMIPPPNVTGILHIGHALNNTIQDIMARWRRMQGRNVVWIPGTDHAGIATQNVVERALKKEGLSRQDLGRDEFIKRVWKWREEYGSTIINQLKMLGASCDWERERFTMDAGLSDAVAEVFVRLYDKKLIYRGNYIINWCPRCHTALSDEESEHADEQGKLYHLKYAIADATEEDEQQYVVVATTRPETLLGDVAVAVNPSDERYKHLQGKTIILPILNRELVVIQDDFVDKEFGTGVVKVTPAHDPNDFEMGLRHNLTQLNVMNGDGTMNDEAGPYAGMDRFECRKKILLQLKADGLIEKIEDHAHAVGHCYRCDTVVEPRLSLQWFVKMKPLAEPALEVVKNGDIKFVPARWTKVYTGWMENIRDWCISRQIWWGHRIPIFYCDSCGNEWAAKGQPESCPKCGKIEIRQDEDVLDTWFSSWLWPFSTLGWPESSKDLDYYYPTHDLVTASEIIFFWVARMIMAGIEFKGDIPFKQVYIHGTVRDDKGLKMSKSLGNSIDPLTIIDEFSADALRFSLMMITATGQDVFLSNDKFEIGRNFGTKMWNAARFMKMHLDKNAETEASKSSDGLSALEAGMMSSDDKHIIAKLQDAIRDCTDNLEKCRFNDAALVMYEFMRHQFCDWYVEYAKTLLNGDDTKKSRHVLNVMEYVFSRALKLLHPIMPFVTEELWHTMGYASRSENGKDFIMSDAWPECLSDDEVQALGIDADSVDYVSDKHDLIREGRTLRADYGVLPSLKVKFMIKPDSEDVAGKLAVDKESVKTLLRAENIEINCAMASEDAMPSGVGKLGMIYMPLEGVIDVEAEMKKLSGQIEKTTSMLARCTGKLSNEAFVSQAPKDVVDLQRLRKKEFLEEIEKLNGLISTLEKV
ncbi:MAG: valine--tRNA ligase [Kiritimatiellae bacterium]|nr:valine--tRNA ligase [Kiritimatiellia bacterium]